MKHLLSIHVYDSTTPSEFDALIELLAGMKSRHAATDPAPGHPEFPLPGMPVAYESTHDGGASNRFLKDFMTAAEQGEPGQDAFIQHVLDIMCENLMRSINPENAWELTKAQLKAESDADSLKPIPHRVTTECHKCGGGTGQEDPCVCAARHAADPAAADPLKVAMDDPVEAEDPTRREFPWGDLPEPPELPEGKTRWVNRGTFEATAIGLGIGTDGRIVYYPDSRTRGEWQRSCDFSGSLHHIEAI